ncbi:alpha-ketoglutarate-dependent dioxygenase alkB-like protein [Aureococcus anophagefferens]|nr:alpha-ketoglutarate-dependent dioxygenase alkB-like protein [Aureococcus anophagefferens]
MGSPLFALVLGAAIAQAAATTVVSTASEFDANMGQLDVVDVVSIELAADLACVSPVSIGAKKQLTISSPPEDEIYSLSSCGSAGLFTVTGQAALTLANVAISGEMNTTISVANEASAALDGVVAAGNAGDTGGFLRAADDATVTVAGGAFSNNSAEDGGVFYFEGNAVAAVDGGVYGGNSASSSAGVIYVADAAQLAWSGGVVAGNAAYLNGGFATVDEDATATVDGGAVFANNTAGVTGDYMDTDGWRYGPGAFAKVRGVLTVGNATVRGHEVAVHVSLGGFVHVLGGNWTENFWHVDFGAVFFIVGFSTVVIDGGTFSKNTAVISGVAHVKRGSLLIRGGEFRDNYGDERGGVACVRGEGSELLVTGGTFANNFALEGGVFFVYEGSLNVSGGVFEGNAPRRGIGGVVYAAEDAVLDGAGSVLSHNSASDGGVLGATAQAVVSLTGATLVGNVARRGGDVAADAAATIDLVGVTSVGAGATAMGGSLHLEPRSRVTVRDVAVARADAPYGGFAYQDLDSVLVVEGSAFDGCSSGVAAGVYTGDQARLTVSNSSFSNGAGAYASALYLLDAADVSLDNVVIAGGASTLAMTGSAAVVLDATGGAFRNVSFRDNVGGALSVAEAAIALTASTFRNNTISGSGAAVALTNRATVAAFECVFAELRFEDGGAVYATFSSEFTSNGSIFVGNVAGRRGGAMRLDGGATVALAPSDVVAGNSAPNGGGGAAYFDISNAYAALNRTDGPTRAAFENNSALYGGRFATGIAAILAEHAGDEAAGEDLKHAIVVSAVDAFGNVVKDTATVLSAELTAGSSLSGTVKMGFVDGVATWEAGEPLQLYGHPGGSLEVVASLESTWVAYAGAAFDEDRAQPYTANLTFTFRQCVPGEFLIGDETGGECILCGVGDSQRDYWYSARGSAWSADAACKRCAAGFVCEDFGQTLDAVVTKGGRYRASPRAEKTYECPGARRACPRGNATGAASCASGYAGARCGSCDRDHYRAMTRDGGMTCETCRSGNNGVIVAVYAVVAVLAGALVAVVFSATGSSLFLAVADTAGGAAEEVVGWASNAALQKRDSKRFALDDSATTSSLSVYVTKVKVVLNFVQIVSAVPMVFGPALELPGSFAALVRLTGLVSGIDVASLLPTRCLFSGQSIATFYAESLATTLLVPIVFALIVNALFWGHRVVGRQTPKEVVERRRIVTQVCLLFIHLTLPICAYAAVSALVSEEIDYGDGETRRFLRVEPAVATASSQYRSVTRVWAILGIFIYPLGAFLALVSVLFTAGYIHAQPFMEDDDDLLAEYDEAIDDAEAACVDGRRGISGSAGGEAYRPFPRQAPAEDAGADDGTYSDVELLDGHGPDEPNKDCSSAPTELLEMITCSANLEEKRGGEPEEGCDVGRSS